MLIVFQSPILDLRLLKLEKSVTYPAELPRTTGAQRTPFPHFGIACNRSSGASETFPDEAFYYSAHNALRLPSFGKDQLRAAGVELQPRIYTNRRVYISEGKLPVRVEVEIGLAAMQKKLDFQSLRRLLAQVLRIPANVPEFTTPPSAPSTPPGTKSQPSANSPRKKGVQSSTLSDIDRALAERFARATTLNQGALTLEDQQLVKPAETSAMVVQLNRDEVDWSDISRNLPWFRRIDRKLMGNADVYAGSLATPRGYQIPCWLISPGQADPDQVRNLRILLLRLHAEYSAADQVLKWFFGETRITSPLDPVKVRQYLEGVRKAWSKPRDPLATKRDAILDGLAILAHARPGSTKKPFIFLLDKALRELPPAPTPGAAPLAPILPKATPWPPTWLAQMEQKPDLVVGINFEEGSPKLEWRFWAADPNVQVPLGPEITDIGTRPEQFGEIPGIPGQAFFEGNMLATGRTIGSKIPSFLWHWLDQFSEPDHKPSILLLTNEPYLIWERAVDDREGANQEFLGARALIGRWPADQTRMPPYRIVIQKAATFSGEYNSGNIKEAQKEAETIKVNLLNSRPPAPRVRPVEIKGETVRKYLQASPDDNLLHFAMHANSADGFTEDGLRFIEGGYLSSGPIGLLKLQKGAPFVFLNACQAGAGRFRLGTLQGIPESFVAAGASAVVAPYWEIEDQKAHDLAIQFYQEVLLSEGQAAKREGQAAEFFCRVREQFGHPNAKPIFLAYKFYGHPLLQLSLPQVAPNEPGNFQTSS